MAGNDEKEASWKGYGEGFTRPRLASHTSASGGRRELNGKELVRYVANQARALGWEEPENFNVVNAYGDAVWMLYQELAAWTAKAKAGKTRGERRAARRIMHNVANTLKDMKQDPARIEAVLNGETKLLLVSGMFDIPVVEPDPTALVMRVAWHRFRMALGAERLSTHKRAVLAIRAFDRLGDAFGRFGIVPPIARVRERAARSYATRGPVVRGECRIEGSSVPESEVRGGVESSEARGEDGSARPSRSDGGERARNMFSEDDDGGWG